MINPSETAIAKAIISLNDINSKFHLSQSPGLDFFPEWFEGLPELTTQEKSTLDKLKNRYLYYRDDGAITEGTINLIIVSPLLEILGLFDHPYKIRGEKSVQIHLESEGKSAEILEGRIDTLVIQNELWLVIIEAKRYGFDPLLAVPQALAYMMANPQRNKPLFGLVTSGNDYVFIKLDQQLSKYDISDKFTLSKRRQNELYEVVSILKNVIQKIGDRLQPLEDELLGELASKALSESSLVGSVEFTKNLEKLADGAT